MNHYTFTFTDGTVFNAIARTFKDACMNVDALMKASGKSIFDVDAVKEFHGNNSHGENLIGG